MNICLIGYGIPSLILANILISKNIKISIFDENKYKNKFDIRTLGITKNNINFLKKEKIDVKKIEWPIKNIKIFNESNKKKEIINFDPSKNKLFSIIKYSQLFNLLENNIKNKKIFKLIKKNKKVLYRSILNGKNEFDLIINFNENNDISKKIFFRRQYKNYDSLAYTTLISHKKCDNRSAYQIFTKLGPIAFLPCSNKETSVVFSVLNQDRNILESEILELINNYNKKYIIKSFSKVEKFDLKGSLLKNYYYKNILCFGDNIHKIHPLAGQGLNMTIRDIKVLSDLINQKIDLGFQLDQSILKEFENKTKHYNYLYANSINFINEFFKLDSKFDNSFSNKLFYFLDKNSLFKKYSIKFADNGLMDY